MLRVAVQVGGRARIVCEVARTATEQARGLQDHPVLADGTGMLFPFHPPRSASFHMGTVAFPIDIIFADASGVVGRIVHGAQPGTRASWSHPVVGAVVEVPGGWCMRHGLEVGGVVRVAGTKLGAQTYNLLRTLTEASTDADAAGSLDEPRGPDDEGHFDVHADPPALMDGYYSKEPQHQAPDFGGKRDKLGPPDSEDAGWPSGGGGRWNDRTLPDRGPNAMDQPSTTWSQAMPYVTPLGTDDPVGGTRMGQVRILTLPLLGAAYKGKRTNLKALLTHALKDGDELTLCGKISAENVADEYSVSPAEQQAPPSCKPCLAKDPRARQARRAARLELARDRFQARANARIAARVAREMEVAVEELVPRLLAGAVRAGIPWKTLVLNDKSERAVITPSVVGFWLHALGLSETERDVVWEAATSEPVLDALATAMIYEKMAEGANIAHLGDQNILVVTRKRTEPWT